MRLSGRFVRVFHWIAPVLLPLLVIFGREIFGAPLGWMTLIAMMISPIVVIGMYIAPIIVVFDRDAKAARSTRLLYDIVSWVMWALLIVVMLTIVDGGDSPPYLSVVSNWNLMTNEASSAVCAVALILAFFAWLGTITVAIVGVVQSRSEAHPGAMASSTLDR